MDLAWNWFTGPSLLAALIFLVAAVTVFLARPGRVQNRLLGVFFLGWVIYSLATGLAHLVPDVSAAYAWTMVGTAGVVVFHVGYALFLGTLPTPRVRWLATPLGRTVVVAVGVLTLVHMLVRSELWQVTMLPGPGAVPWINQPGPAWIPLDGLSIILMGFAILAALSAHRRAQGPLARRQTRSYLVGFAVFDAVIAALVAVTLAGVLIEGELWWGRWFTWGFFFAGIWLVSALSYGVLTAQLFDIDLKIKWTLRQSTVAAVFIAVFFIASEGAAALFEAQTGSTVAGILAAGALVFAIAPLQGLAERVADKAMPHVHDTAEYLTVRKQEVYRATVQGALVDGVISERERDMLATLADQLSLSAGDARAIERQASRKVD